MSLQYCVEKARELPYSKGQFRLYAVIIDKKGRIIAESANSYTCTHPKQYRVAKRLGKPLKTFLHAESAVLIKSRGKGSKLIVARVLADGSPANASPCNICQAMIKLHGSIKSVEYSV